MDLTGCYFKYNNISSRTYGLVFAHCDTSEYTSLNGETSTITLYNKRNNRRYYIDDDFSNPISFEAEICISPERFTPLSDSEVTAVERWLFNKRGYFELSEDDNSGIIFAYTKRYLKCRFINPKKICQGNYIIGFSFTVECDSAFMWEEHTDNLTFGPGVSTTFSYTITVDSDIDEYIYPKMTIKVKNGGSIAIVNNSDSPNRVTAFSGISPLIDLKIDSELNTVSGQNYSKMIQRNFVRLVPGANNLKFDGSISGVTITHTAKKYL